MGSRLRRRRVLHANRHREAEEGATTPFAITTATASPWTSSCTRTAQEQHGRRPPARATASDSTMRGRGTTRNRRPVAAAGQRPVRIACRGPHHRRATGRGIATLIVEVAAPMTSITFPHIAVSRSLPASTPETVGPSKLAQTVREYACQKCADTAGSPAKPPNRGQSASIFRSLGWTIDQYDITGYWRDDSETWDAGSPRWRDEVLPVYERALTTARATSSPSRSSTRRANGRPVAP